MSSPRGSSSSARPAQVVERLQKVAGATAIVMAGVVASRVVGMVRDVVITAQFGVGRELDVYLAANRVPDTVFQVLAGGAVGAAFIPVFTGYMARGEREEAWKVASSLMNLAVAAMAPIALALALLADFLMMVLVPGWDAPSRATAANLARIMLAAPAIFAVSTLATSVLNAQHRFALAAAAPLMYNLSIIGGAIILRPLGTYGLAVGVVVGALLHLLVQVPGLLRVGLRYSWSLSLRHPGVREVIRLTGPRVLTLGVAQINLLVNLMLASFLGEGAVAALNYAWILVMVPLGVFAMATSTALFPTMAEEGAQRRYRELAELTSLGLRLILFLTVPASVGLVLLATPLIRVLFERGLFTSESTAALAFALALYAPGLAGHAAVEVLNRGFYALHDTRTPLQVAAVAAAANIALGVVLMQTPLTYGGLALANSLAALLEAGLLLSLLTHRLGASLRPGALLGPLARVAVAATAMGLAMAPVARRMTVAEVATPVQAVMVVATAGAGAALYLALATLLRSREAGLLWQLARHAGGSWRDVPSPPGA